MFNRQMLGLSLIACSTLAGATNTEIFRDRVAPILTKNCASCHSVGAPASNLSVATLDALLAGGKHGPAINPGDAAHSLLLQYVRGEKTPAMPLGGKLAPETVAELTAAINAMTPLPMLTRKRDPHMDWLLRKPVMPAVPTVQRASWVVNPIDAFVLARLEAKGLAPAPPADRRALVRRVYFDLIGLPPTPNEVQAFAADTAPDAYGKLVDKLLADPRYGERWARHWLDLVRFAESDGFAIDGERPTAWRYRDYVIRAFNRDKPYDLFVKEQLAGDEITDKRAKAEDKPERAVALGYLRMGTWEADANFKTQLRQDFLNEITTTTGQVFLGFTVGCARCHDHKYDPIPQKDFYRLQAFFAATRTDDRPAPFLDVEHPSERKAEFRRFEDEAEVTGDAAKKFDEELKKKFASDHSKNDFGKAIKDTKNPAFTADERKKWESLHDAARRAKESVPRYLPLAYSVSDVVPPQVPAVADTFVLGGGELSGKGEKVEPGFLSSVTGKSEPAVIPFSGEGSGRREALAEWIASADNPLTARVIMNRIWQHHFGEGIVRTPSDFGINGDRPSHPELLDWLALEFIEKGWSVKAIHRLMLTSNAYQQASESPELQKASAADPDNRLLWRANWHRLEAEVLRDSLLAVSGRLQSESGGPGVYLDIPADVAGGFEFFKWFPSDEKSQLRRTIYTFQRRSVAMPMIETFDGANMSESCSRRNATTVAPQAFSLLNSEFTNSEAKHFAERVIELAGPDRERQTEESFLLVLGRKPTEAEKRKTAEVLANLSSREALTRLGVVLFNSNEFLYLE